MRYLGIDFGSKRVGVALSDEGNSFALPLKVLPNDKNLLDEIQKICQQNDVGCVVMGESKDFSGKDNPIMERINDFVAQLSLTMPEVRIELEPEFLTSAQAERLGNRRPDREVERTRQKKGKNEMLDASSAALILKSFLEKCANDKK
ncbi:MAG: Holliday junction resolvase RuvX [Candidatus Paceibacterota bacterium]